MLSPRIPGLFIPWMLKTKHQSISISAFTQGLCRVSSDCILVPLIEEFIQLNVLKRVLLRCKSTTSNDETEMTPLQALLPMTSIVLATKLADITLIIARSKYINIWQVLIHTVAPIREVCAYIIALGLVKSRLLNDSRFLKRAFLSSLLVRALAGLTGSTSPLYTLLHTVPKRTITSISNIVDSRVKFVPNSVVLKKFDVMKVALRNIVDIVWIGVLIQAGIFIVKEYTSINNLKANKDTEKRNPALNTVI